MDGERVRRTDALLTEQRGRLFAIAYRMLGDAGEAEDAVQEAFVRWTQADRDAIVTPAAWLTTVLTRLCLDRLGSARRRRETYVGPWLPEPIATDHADPAGTAELTDTLTLAFLVVLESLSPAERAAFLLQDVFGYRAGEVGAMLGRSPEAVRQLTSRARGHLRDRRPRYERDGERRRAVADAFIAAVAGQDLDGLMALLAPDVTFVADGGGVVPAARHPQQGAERVAGVLLRIAGLATDDWSVVVREVNGEPGLVARRPDGTVDSVWVLHVIDDRVAAVHAMRNPTKLRAIAASLRD